MNVKCAVSLNYESALLRKYLTATAQPTWKTVKNGLRIGMLYGLAYLIMFWNIGLLYLVDYFKVLEHKIQGY